MKVALCAPEGEVPSWLGDMATGLGSRGHEAVILARRGAAVPPGVRAVRRRPVPEPRRASMYEPGIAALPAVVWLLLREAFDVAATFTPADGWAGLVARRAGGPSVAFFLPEALQRSYLVRRRYRLEIVRRLFEEADAIAAPTTEVAVTAGRLFGAHPPVVALGDLDSVAGLLARASTA